MEYPFIFIDLETTGHDPVRLVDGVLTPWHEIIEIGAVTADQRTLEERSSFSCKARPEHPERCAPDSVNHYPPRAAAGEWDKAPDLEDAIWRFLSWTEAQSPDGPSLPVGQNPAFDWLFLLVAFAMHGITDGIWQRYFHYGRLDTRSMAVQALWPPGFPYEADAYSLRNPALADTLGIPPEPYPHEAINGARTSLAVFRRLQELKRRSS